MRYAVALMIIAGLLAVPVALMMGFVWWHALLLAFALIVSAAVLDTQADKAADDR